MQIPSFDFGLFSVPSFSPLQAQEFGAMTDFSANTPTPFIDFSLSQFLGLTQPNNAYPYAQRQIPTRIVPYELEQFFQGQDRSRAEIEAEVRRREEAFRKAEEDARRSGALNIWDILQGKTVRSGGSGPIVGDQKTVSDGPDVLATEGSKKVGATFDQVKMWLDALPGGAATFLIAVVIIILLVLFAGRR